MRLLNQVRQINYMKDLILQPFQKTLIKQNQDVLIQMVEEDRKNLPSVSKSLNEALSTDLTHGTTEKLLQQIYGEDVTKQVLDYMKQKVNRGLTMKNS